jgi:hypothetical protein
MYFRVKQPSLYKEITYSNALSVTMFILTATIIFHALGRSFLGDMAGFFIKETVYLFATIFSKYYSMQIRVAILNLLQIFVIH